MDITDSTNNIETVYNLQPENVCSKRLPISLADENDKPTNNANRMDVTGIKLQYLKNELILASSPCQPQQPLGFDFISEQTSANIKYSGCSDEHLSCKDPYLSDDVCLDSMISFNDNLTQTDTLSSIPSSMSLKEPPFIEDLQPDNLHILAGMEIELVAQYVGTPILYAKWLKGGDQLIQGMYQFLVFNVLEVVTN